MHAHRLRHRYGRAKTTVPPVFRDLGDKVRFLYATRANDTSRDGKVLVKEGTSEVDHGVAWLHDLACFQVGGLWEREFYARVFDLKVT